MKIFEWIHRKFRQNNGEGQGLHRSHMEGRGVREEEEEEEADKWKSPRSMSITSNHVEDGGGGESTDMSGLLSIGTLGLYHPHHIQQDSLEGGPALSELQSDMVTAFEVEIFHGHLELAFGLKPQNNSHDQVKVECDSATVERCSNANNNVYPLHEFFNSPSSVTLVEPSQTRPKERRTSLGDLFSISKQELTASSTQSNKDQSHKTAKDSAPQKPGSSLASVKKVLKRKTKSNSTQAAKSDCKLDKVIGFFHKKIFPEETAQQNDTAHSNPHVGATINKQRKCLSGLGLSNCILPRAYEADKDPDDASAHSHFHDMVIHLPDQPPPQPRTQGHWIKTDDEYVVLEL